MQVRKLADVGEEMLVLCHNVKTGQTNKFGTECGLAFAKKRPDLLTGFVGFVGGM